MTTINAQWCTAFNALTIQDAGLTDTELSRYSDLQPKEAALTFGEDHDLERVDRGWFG